MSRPIALIRLTALALLLARGPIPAFALEQTRANPSKPSGALKDETRVRAEINVKPPAAGDGPQDDTQELQTAFSEAAAGGHIAIPCGKYRITAAIKTRLAAGRGLRVAGGGNECTVLYFPSGDGMEITYASAASSTTWSDLTITTGQASKQTIGVSLIADFNNPNPALGASSSFTNVTLRGDDGYGAAYFWGRGVKASAVSNIAFNNFQYNGSGHNGVGFHAVGKPGKNCVDGPCYGVAYLFNNSTFESYDVGILYGDLTQGYFISNGDFTGGATAIGVERGASGLDQLSILNSQFGKTVVDLGNGNVGAANVSNNLFITPPGSTGFVMNSAHFVFNGNTMTGDPTSTALACPSKAGNGAIMGNSFANFSTGIHIEAGCSNVNVQSNTYLSVKKQVSNHGEAIRCGAGCGPGTNGPTN